METLQGVKNVHNVVERILFEVTLRHFPCEADKRLKVNIRKLEQIVELEDLVHQELQTWLIQNLVEMESIERSHIDSVERHF